jgi:hypothetical protein
MKEILNTFQKGKPNMKKGNHTAEEVLENLKNMGVKFEKTNAPFSRESKNVSMMGMRNFRIVIRDKKSISQRIFDQVKNNLKFSLKTKK